MLSGDRFPNNGNINFDETYFSQLRSELISAQNKGIAITIVLFSGTAFEGDRTAGSGFGQNAWNACYRRSNRYLRFPFSTERR